MSAGTPPVTVGVNSCRASAVRRRPPPPDRRPAGAGRRARRRRFSALPGCPPGVAAGARCVRGAAEGRALPDAARHVAAPLERRRAALREQDRQLLQVPSARRKRRGRPRGVRGAGPRHADRRSRGLRAHSPRRHGQAGQPAGRIRVRLLRRGRAGEPRPSAAAIRQRGNGGRDGGAVLGGAGARRSLR